MSCERRMSVWWMESSDDRFNVAQLGNHGPDHADDNPGVKLMSKLLGARVAP